MVSILERQAVAAAAHINRCLLRVQWSSGPFVLDVWPTAFPLEEATGEATPLVKVDRVEQNLTNVKVKPQNGLTP